MNNPSITEGDNEMGFYVGIEAIGMSFSVAVLAEADGTIVAAARGKPFSLHASDRGVLREGLILLMNDLLASVRGFRWANANVCIGLTGVTFPYDAAVDLPEELARLGINTPPSQLICTGDAEIITAAYTQESAAAALIAHMGSTAYVYDNTRTYRFGGWGPQLGDEGSAFAIGRNAVRTILADYDRKKKSGLMWKLMRDWLFEPHPRREYWVRSSDRWKQCRTKCMEMQQDERTALFSLAHSLSVEDTEHWRCLASGLAIPVLTAWKQGDDSARQLVDDAAHSLAIQVVSLTQQANISLSHVPIVLYGGLFRYHPEYVTLVIQHIKGMASLPLVHEICPDHAIAVRPVCGALMFALGNSSTFELKLPSQQKLDQIRTSAKASKFATQLHND